MTEDIGRIVAFDLPAEAGRSLLDLPLVEPRKARLQALLTGMPAQSVLFVSDFRARGETVSHSAEPAARRFYGKAASSPVQTRPSAAATG